MIGDRQRLALGGPLRTTLDPLACPVAGALEGALGIGVSLETDRQPRGVHHDEHVLEAAIGLAHEVANRTVLLSVHHHARRTAVDAELVLDGCAADVIALAERAVVVDEELRHNEQ